MKKGRVTFFDDHNGYGIIVDKVQKTPVLVHFSVIKVNANERKSLKEGQNVLFEATIIEGKQVAEMVILND